MPANPQPKQIYKQKQYIFGPRTGRIHLDDGALATDDEPTTEQPWWQRGQNLAPGMAGVTEDQLNAPAPAAPLAPPPVVEDDEPKVRKEYTDALAAQKEWNQYKPERGQPKWWQRALAGGLGGAAGYVNAAGRTRHPIDTAQATENILHPGYQGRLQDWQSRADALGQEAGLEGQLQNAQLKSEQIKAQAAAREALAAQHREMADPHYRKTPVDPAELKVKYPALAVNVEPDGFVWLPDKTAEAINKPTKEPVDRGEAVIDPEIAEYLGRRVGDYVDRDIYKQALVHKNAMAIAGMKPVNEKEDKVALARKAAEGDQGAQKALDILAKNTLAGRPPRAAGSGAPSIINITSDAIDQQARNILSGGTLPALGYGKEAAAVRAKILNRAAEMNPQADLNSARAENKALSGAMASQEKMAGQIGSFENTANRNMDVALQLSNKINRTGIPLLNRWIQAGRENIMGDPDASAFHAAINTVANEYAKVVSTATGGGVTSDSARAEAMSLLNTAQTPQQLKAVIATMRKDMANRIASFKQTHAEHSERIGSIGNQNRAQQASPTPPPGTTSGNPNPGGYIAGHVYGGLTYLGGDPNSPASWRK